MGHGIDASMISGKIAGQILGVLCHGEDYSTKVLQVYFGAVWQEYGAYFQHRLALRKRFESSPPMTRMSLLNTDLFNGSGVITHHDSSYNYQ